VGVLGALEQFDRAVERGTAGRRAHVGARAELEAIADEMGQVVRLMDGSNRFRFASDPESLAAWESASNTFGPPRPGGQPSVLVYPFSPFRLPACPPARLSAPFHAPFTSDDQITSDLLATAPQPSPPSEGP
jgi:hypothetical protein